MPVGIVYNVEGVEPTRHKLMAFAARAIEPAPALLIVAETLRTILAKRFDAEGSGEWPALAESTIAKKGHDWIGEESGAMEESLTVKGAEGSLEEILGDELFFGTNLTNEEGFPYPVVFNDGTTDGTQPARPLMHFTVEDLKLMSKGIQAYLVGLDRAEFGLNNGGDRIPGSDLMPRF